MERTVLVFNSTSDPVAIAKQANKIRLANKGQWYQLVFENETTGERTNLKCFDTWVQKSNSKVFGTVMGVNPTGFKKNIEQGIEELIKKY